MKIRPTFDFVSADSPDDVREKMKLLQKKSAQCDADVLKRYALLRIPDEAMHYWSPQLNVEWLEDPEGTRIKGRFGPRPSVWTLFAGFYLFSVFLGVMGGIFGLAQRQLNMDAWALWCVPVSIVFLAISYTVAASGQKLGHDQMAELEKLLRESLHVQSRA